MNARILIICWLLQSVFASVVTADEFAGKHYRGRGDVEYLELLEKARRFFDPDPVLPNISMLYSSSLNSLVKGSTWDAWWIQNSYGTTYCALPFLQEPYLTFLQNAQDFWFDQMGDGKRIGANDWQAPDGCLCDCAKPRLMTTEGYFVRSIDPDGTLHGVYRAPIHGYFETTPNQDAIAFRVVDDQQAKTIYSKIASIPGLRPFKLIIPNYPAYDDMYEKETGIWKFGTWINGGHWSTCEGRMMMAYSRLGKYEDMRQSMKQIMTFAGNFRMDNPLTKFGSDVYQPAQPYNVTYDAFAIPAALIRGLFEYLYRADGLTLIPHIPEGITEIQQLDPVRIGNKKLWLLAKGSGEITYVEINGEKWRSFDKTSVYLPYDKLPDNASIIILFGNTKMDHRTAVPFVPQTTITHDFLQSVSDTSAGSEELKNRMIRRFAGSGRPALSENCRETLYGN